MILLFIHMNNCVWDFLESSKGIREVLAQKNIDTFYRSQNTYPNAILVAKKNHQLKKNLKLLGLSSAIASQMHKNHILSHESKIYVLFQGIFQNDDGIQKNQQMRIDDFDLQNIDRIPSVSNTAEDASFWRDVFNEFFENTQIESSNINYLIKLRLASIFGENNVTVESIQLGSLVNELSTISQTSSISKKILKKQQLGSILSYLSRSTESASVVFYISENGSQIEFYSSSISLQQSAMMSPSFLHKRSFIQDQYQAVGLLICIPDHQKYVCCSTATLIGPDIVLGCSHALKDRIGKLCVKFIFIRGCTSNKSTERYNIHPLNVNTYRSSQAHLQLKDGLPGKQLALLRLKNSINIDKYPKIVPFSQNILNKQISIIGYTDSQVKYDPYFKEVTKQEVSRTTFRGQCIKYSQKYNMIEHKEKTTKGCSGGPIFAQYLNEKGKIEKGIVGMHTAQGKRLDVHNMGLLFTKTVHSAFEKYKQQLT